MNRATQILHGAQGTARLGLFSPPPTEVNIAYWKINGYRASIVVWTSEEWESLAERPNDAQYYPCGVWCALRIE